MESWRRHHAKSSLRSVIEENFPPLAKEEFERSSVLLYSNISSPLRKTSKNDGSLGRDNSRVSRCSRLIRSISQHGPAQTLQNLFETPCFPDISDAPILHSATLATQSIVNTAAEVALRKRSNGYCSLRLPASCSIGAGFENSLPYLDGPAEHANLKPVKRDDSLLDESTGD